MKTNLPTSMFAKLCGILFLLGGWALAHAQIGIGTTSPHPSAILHISPGAGNNKGLIVPTVTTANRILLDSTQNISNGLLFFDQNLQKFYYFNQSPRVWKEIDSDWIRKDVHSASPVVGTHLYLGVAGNVGIGTLATDDPNAKLTVRGTFLLGDPAWVQDSTPPAIGGGGTAVIQTWLGIGTATRTSSTERLKVAGDATITDDLVVVDDVTADRYFGEGVSPIGCITMWSGTVASNFDSNGEGIGGLTGWALCDGRGGRPDLRGRFIVGRTDNLANGPDYINSERNHADYRNIADFGGEASVTLTTNEMPSHSHTGTATSSGSSHNHTYQHANDYDGYVGNYNGDPEVFTWNDYGNRNTSTDGAHTHNLDINSTGGGQAHENRPPYYVLAFIIKLP
jgi:microcystin-dependent protein